MWARNKLGRHRHNTLHMNYARVQLMPALTNQYTGKLMICQCLCKLKHFGLSKVKSIDNIQLTQTAKLGKHKSDLKKTIS